MLLDATAVDGEDVHTTLDPDVQAAAEKALEGAGDTPAALVAVDVPTGGVLAAANSPSTGFDRALTGRYAPGSAFKIATTYAYLTGGVTTPSARVACPPTVVVDGKSFRNYEGETLGNPTFGDDFAHSCNTAFIGLADRLGSTDLTDAAEALGVGAGWASTLGVDGTFGGSVPADDRSDRPGGGRDRPGPDRGLAASRSPSWSGRSPAAAYVAPTLVLPDGETPDGRTVTPTALDAGRPRRSGRSCAGSSPAARRRSCRARPVARCRARPGRRSSGRSHPRRPAPGSSAYQGDVAFAVLVEEGRSGGSVAAPIAKAFLTDLATAS